MLAVTVTPAVSTSISQGDSWEAWAGSQAVAGFPPAPPTVLGGPFLRAPGCAGMPGSLCLLPPLSLQGVLRFDNTYSLIHAKKISYTVGCCCPTRPLRRRFRVSRTRDSPHCSEDPAAPVPELSDPSAPCPVPALPGRAVQKGTTESLHLSSPGCLSSLWARLARRPSRKGTPVCWITGRSGGHCIPVQREP